MLHIDGNMQPGVPVSPENMKVDVYLTPFIPTDIPGGEIAISRLVQLFIEGIGVPAALRWEKAMANIGELRFRRGSYFTQKNLPLEHARRCEVGSKNHRSWDQEVPPSSQAIQLG